MQFQTILALSLDFFVSLSIITVYLLLKKIVVNFVKEKRDYHDGERISLNRLYLNEHLIIIVT